MIKLTDSLHLFRDDLMSLILLVSTSHPILPGNLHLFKLESVQTNQRKKHTVDLIKISGEKAVFFHIHRVWMCVCHKLGLLRERSWASHMATLRLRHTKKGFYSWINSDPFIWSVIISSKHSRNNMVINPMRLSTTMKIVNDQTS